MKQVGASVKLVLGDATNLELTNSRLNSPIRERIWLHACWGVTVSPVVIGWKSMSEWGFVQEIKVLAKQVKLSPPTKEAYKYFSFINRKYELIEA